MPYIYSVNMLKYVEWVVLHAYALQWSTQTVVKREGCIVLDWTHYKLVPKFRTFH